MLKEGSHAQNQTYMCRNAMCIRIIRAPTPHFGHRVFLVAAR